MRSVLKDVLIFFQARGIDPLMEGFHSIYMYTVHVHHMHHYDLQVYHHPLPTAYHLAADFSLQSNFANVISNSISSYMYLYSQD